MGQKSIYSILNNHAKSWWYHKKCREMGEVDAARKMERASIKKDLEMLRSIVENGGWISAGVGNHVCHYIDNNGNYCRVQGYDQDDMLEIARRLGIPAYDVREAAIKRTAAVIKAVFELDAPMPVEAGVKDYRVVYSGFNKSEVRKHIAEYCEVSGAIAYL